MTKGLDCLPWVSVELSNLSPRTKRWLEGEFELQHSANEKVKDLRCLPVTLDELYNLSTGAKRWIERELGLQIIDTPESIYIKRKENSDDEA